METIFITLLIALVIILLSYMIISLIIRKVPSLYNYVYNHKETMRWEWFIENARDFKPAARDSELAQGIFELKDEFDNVRYVAVVWNDGLSSIHAPSHECICCSFNKKASKKMADKLINNNK